MTDEDILFEFAMHRQITTATYRKYARRYPELRWPLFYYYVMMKE